MAKSKDKVHREAKKPKADKNVPKGPSSPYKQSQIKGVLSIHSFEKK